MTFDPGAVESLLRPRQVAVIGASAQRVTLGNTVLRNFERWPFGGEIIPVHPTATVIEGRPTVPRVADLPQGLHAAVVCVPAAAVADVLMELDATGCRSAVVVAAGFTPEEMARLRDVLGRVRVAVCGPNNMGFINATDSIALYTARFRDPLPVGGVALIAQSGSAAIALVNTPGLGFSKIITSGNEPSLAAPDYLRWLAQDNATTIAGIVLESIQNGKDFGEAARGFMEAGKRLAVLKVGRTPAGSAAAQAHTGALIGADAAFQAFFRRHGIPQAQDYDELAAMLQCGGRASGRRIGIVAISGGEAALAADVATERGIPLARFSEGTQARLGELLPGARLDNPLDLHAAPTRVPNAQELALQAVLADPAVDVVLVLQDAQHSLPIHDAHDYVRQLEMVRRVAAQAATPVVVASTTSAETHPRLEQVLAGSPIPLLRGIREAVAAAGSLGARATSVAAPTAIASPWSARLAPHTGPLPHALTRELLAAYGIPLVRSTVVHGADQALAAARDLGYPLAVKVVSQQITHRSDVGGVVLGVGSDDDLRAALARRPQAEAYELQPMVTRAVEALVGFAADPTFGGTVTVAMGGVLVELFGQHATELVPVDVDLAADMIRHTPLGRILAGYRNLVPPTPIEPLASVVASVSRLGAELAAAVAAADLNPVMVRHGTGEALAVDALVIVKGGADAT